MMVSTSLRPVRAQHSRPLSTRPSRRHSRISHRRLPAAIPSHHLIQLSPPRTRTMTAHSSSAPELGRHVLVAPRVITSVNTRPRLHPNLQIPQSPVVHVARSGNRHKKIWPHYPPLTVVSKQRYLNSCHFIIPTIRP